MRNNLGALNDYLFEQLERVNDDELTGDELKEQLEKTKAICNIADKIVRNASVIIQGIKAKNNDGYVEDEGMPRLLGPSGCR